MRLAPSFSLLALLLLSSTRALADDKAPDTVNLVNGGLVRGTVMEEDPQNGVTLQLIDGTTKKIPAKQVKNVDYAKPAAPPAAPLPAPAVSASSPFGFAPNPSAAMPVYAYGPPPGTVMVPPQAQKERRSKALMILGLIAMPVGAIALGAGAGLFVDGNATHDSGYTYTDSYGISENGNEAHGIDSEVTAGEGLMAAGGVLLATGIVFTIVGATKVTKGPDVDAKLSPRGFSLAGHF